MKPPKPFNAQDAFAQLVEDVRTGLVGRPVAIPNGGTKFVPHRTDIDLNLPVFYLVGDHHQIPMGDAMKAWDQIIDKTFHLPYPRCAFLMSLPGTHPGLQHHKPRFHVRHSYVVVAEEDDEGLHLVPFMTFEGIGRWVRQLFDIYVMFGDEAVLTTYDPAWGDFPADFIERVESSLWMRLMGTLGFVYQLMSRRGTATPVTGTEVSGKIEARRNKMSLPPIQRVVAIDLNKTPSTGEGTPGKGAGIPKRPHFRRGSWHTRKATGKRSWHSPVAVHGGAEVIPPWYEVKVADARAP